MIASGLDLLRDWLGLVRRMNPIYVERDAQVQAAAEIFRRFGLKDEARWHCRGIKEPLPWSRHQGYTTFGFWAQEFIGEAYFRLEELAEKNKIHIPM